MTLQPPYPPPLATLVVHKEEEVLEPPPHLVRLNAVSRLWSEKMLQEVLRAANAALDFVQARSAHDGEDDTKIDTTRSKKSREKPVALSVSILCTDERRMRALNRRFRNKHAACDSLAFPAFEPQGDRRDTFALPACDDAFCDFHDPHIFLGDLALGYEGLQRTIDRYGLEAHAHCAHMTIHSVLHLAGFLHDTHERSATMEAVEGRILARIGFASSEPLALP